MRWYRQNLWLFRRLLFLNRRCSRSGETFRLGHSLSRRSQLQIFVTMPVDKTTLGNYGSALNSYISFTTLHNFPIDPTPDTLSFYTVYMCHYINPRTVNTYLSGISQQLEPYFPSVREARSSSIVRRTLLGCMRMHAARARGTANVRKRTEDLQLVTDGD